VSILASPFDVSVGAEHHIDRAFLLVTANDQELRMSASASRSQSGVAEVKRAAEKHFNIGR